MASSSRTIAVFYDGVVVPGALLLLISGLGLIVEFYDLSEVLETPSDARQKELVPTFTHFLDIPLLPVIVSLGVLRPDTWTQAVVGIGVASGVAACLTVALPRLYPWQPKGSLDCGR